MGQYNSIKKKYQDAILFFRMGDFYEMFYDDARIASEVLGLTLTSRAHGKSSDVPLAGFPHHSLEVYLSRMLKAGHKVAICEQVEDPRKAKGIVKRAVLEVVTPGTSTSDNVIDAAANNYLVSIFSQDGILGMAGVDVSTGDFFLLEDETDKIISQIEGLSPSEIIVPIDQFNKIRPLIKWSPEPIFTKVEDYYFSYEYAFEVLKEHFKTVSLKGFGCEDKNSGISAAGAAVKYLQSLQDESRLGHIRKMSTLNTANYMDLDKATRRNLEILAPMREENKQGSLLAVLDRTVTRMGARLLKMWLVRPLLDKTAIQKRLQCVEEFIGQYDIRDSVTDILDDINDIERITAKINSRKANARDIRGLGKSLEKIPEIKDLLKDCTSVLLKKYKKELRPLNNIVKEIDKAIVDDPPVSINDGRLIRTGYNKELDELKDMVKGGKKWISDLQMTERDRTGISSLKINYNKVFGYYIEVTKTHLSKVPEHYIRKQTLVNAERYITPEMKEKEEKILNAEEKMVRFESELFEKLRSVIAEETASLQQNAELIANLDVLCGFARIAEENEYCKPEIVKSHELKIIESRHPVVEKLLPPGEPFIPNDLVMDPSDDEQIHILTGPNMSGKSTILRQMGLCVLMAQIGSFVPAKSAKIGIVDRIFTRVGAQDDVSRGESTFLVEMLELANILNSATPASLILLDEIGRGTSTFDGLSIAWATVEHLHNRQDVAAKTLFATHYHELTSIPRMLPRVSNYHVAVKEWGDSIIFLHKMEKGGSDHSYGIQVAQMAGVPDSIVNRAKVLLNILEATELSPNLLSLQEVDGEEQPDSGYQINLFTVEDSLLRKALHKIDPESISPLEAINKLFELKEILFGKGNSGSIESD
ncbi:MAG: DNA mismatch repair protein MutS [bacterium]|nr:DNA mismatch repair protein MutS [bacterium]